MIEFRGLRELLAVSVVTGALAVGALLGSTSSLQKRTAIRVECGGDVAACEAAEAVALDIWSERRAPHMPIDVVVDLAGLAKLREMRVGFTVLVDDIDAEADAERMRIEHATIAQPADWFREYRDYRAISERLIELAKLAPDRVEMEGIGSSLESRTIWALRIGNGKTPMLVNGTQHAREWIAAMTTTCIADRLVRDYDKDPEIKNFVDTTELWVVPVVNPDGYQYSWTSDRYWRKNRRGGFGVDLNRNWSVAWGNSGSSGWKRAQDYRGEYAFSEPESVAVRNLAKREQPKAHIDFHAYGQLLLYPWNYTGTPTKDQGRYAATGDRIASAIFAQHGTRYTLMKGVELYPAAGTATDWFYGDVGATSFTIELRPKGRGGFVLPPDEIRPTCDEGLAALLELRKSL